MEGEVLESQGLEARKGSQPPRQAAGPSGSPSTAGTRALRVNLWAPCSLQGSAAQEAGTVQALRTWFVQGQGSLPSCETWEGWGWL